jgi:hypothetical protein
VRPGRLDDDGDTWTGHGTANQVWQTNDACTGLAYARGLSNLSVDATINNVDVEALQATATANSATATANAATLAAHATALASLSPDPRPPCELPSIRFVGLDPSYCVDFAGYAGVPASKGMITQTPRATWSFWYNRQANNLQSHIFDWQPVGIYTTTTNTVCFSLAAVNPNPITVACIASALDTWQHFTFVYTSHTDKTPTLTGYLNGVLAVIVPRPLFVQHPVYQIAVLGLCGACGNTGFANGYLKELRAWDMVLTTDQVRDNARAPHLSYTPVAPKRMRLHLRFDGPISQVSAAINANEPTVLENLAESGWEPHCYSGVLYETYPPNAGSCREPWEYNVA